MGIRVRIKPWQIAVLVAPIAAIVVFLLMAASQQIRTWGLNWVWAVVIFVLLGWRWLVVHWTRPALAQSAALVAEVNAELEAKSQLSLAAGDAGDVGELIEAELAQLLQVAAEDPPIWEDWPTFWQRALSLVTLVSQAYHQR